MLLKVLQIHIDRAGRRCVDCVVALAVNDVLNPKYRAFVTQANVHIMRADVAPMGKMEDHLNSIPNSTRLHKYIRDYDIFDDAKPDEFEIDIPPEYLRVA